MMTMFSIGLHFMLTTPKWYRQSRDNHKLEEPQFKPCNLSLIDGTVSYPATTADLISCDVPVGNVFRCWRCLCETRDDSFGYSVNNSHTDDCYTDASVTKYPGVERPPCALWKTAMNFSTDPTSAWQQRCFCLISADLVLPFWMLLFFRTLEYDARRQILYRKGCSTFLGLFAAPTLNGG